MKILVIPDTHGKLKVLEKARPWFDKVDHIVHLGDYVDSEDPQCPTSQLVQCFREWLAVKEQDPERVTLLVGNHEFAYLDPEIYLVTKHRYDLENFLGTYLSVHKNIIQMAWAQDGWLFTHAGLSNTFVQHYQALFGGLEGKIDEKLNTLYKTHEEIFWDNDSPIWIREALLSDSYPGYNQVVGHTPYKEVWEYQDGKNRIIHCDTWHLDKEKLLEGIRTPMGSQSLVLIDGEEVTVL